MIPILSHVVVNVAFDLVGVVISFIFRVALDAYSLKKKAEFWAAVHSGGGFWRVPP